MVQLTFRKVDNDDAPFLWEMLFHAARMQEDGATSSEAAKSDPFLAQYVADWEKPGDFGIIASDALSQQKLGAAWLRLIADNETNVTYVAAAIPELAIATVPQARGKGIGSALLKEVIEQAQVLYPAIVLSVRDDNPAIQLYKRFGFVVIDEITNRVGTKSLKMLLTLPQ